MGVVRLEVPALPRGALHNPEVGARLGAPAACSLQRRVAPQSLRLLLQACVAGLAPCWEGQDVLVL